MSARDALEALVDDDVALAPAGLWSSILPEHAAPADAVPPVSQLDVTQRRAIASDGRVPVPKRSSRGARASATGSGRRCRIEPRGRRGRRPRAWRGGHLPEPPPAGGGRALHRATVRYGVSWVTARERLSLGVISTTPSEGTRLSGSFREANPPQSSAVSTAVP